MRRRNPDAGLVVFWIKLMQRGCSRSIPGLYRFFVSRVLWLLNQPAPNTLLSPMSKCSIPVSASRLMSNISWSGLLPPDTMERQKEATAKTMSVSMLLKLSIPLRTSADNWNFTTAGITITFLCGLWAGNHRMRYLEIICGRCNLCLTNLQINVHFLLFLRFQHFKYASLHNKTNQELQLPINFSSYSPSFLHSTSVPLKNANNNTPSLKTLTWSMHFQRKMGCQHFFRQLF